MEVLSTLVGFVVGVVAAGIAVELGLKKWFSAPDSSKLTTIWSLTELQSPEIVATSLHAGVEVPANARIVSAGDVPPSRKGLNVRRNTEARGSFAIDAHRARAVLFLGAIEKGTLALWTVDERIIERLRAEFSRLWTRSTDYVERATVADIASKANVTVETRGIVQDVIPYKGRYMLRLTDHGDAVGVLVDQDLQVRGQKVTVKGIVRTSRSGYPLVEALEVKQEA